MSKVVRMVVLIVLVAGSLSAQTVQAKSSVLDPLPTCASLGASP